MKDLTIIAAGSVDGILTSAATLNFYGGSDTEIIFTQAFTVDKIDISVWKPNRNVMFVDLAVNNKNPEMTYKFVNNILTAGHQVKAVIDEHDAEAWIEALPGQVFEDLIIHPKSQSNGVFNSSGAVLWNLELDNHVQELCWNADQADAMDFSGHFSNIVNKAIKSAIQDNSRREYLARHFAYYREPDEKIVGWMAEYDEILKNHESVMSGAVSDSGILFLDCTGIKVDMTVLMKEAYEKPGMEIVAVRGEMYNPAKKRKEVQVSFGTRVSGLDILTILKNAGIECGGFASKANVPVESAGKAAEILKKRLKS